MKFNLEQIKRKMLVKYPFFGGIIANIKYIETDEVKTAATDGINVYYNPSFFETLNKEEQTFVLSHETCHIAFDHIRRSEGKEHELWNIATDAVINANLERDGLKMPEGGVRVEDALNYNSEELYEKLKEEQEALEQMNGQGQEGQPDQNQKGQSSGSQGNSSSDENEESQDQNSQTQSSSNNKKQDEKDKDKSQGQGNSSQESDDEENSKDSSSKGDKKDEKDKNDQSSGASSNEDKDDKDKDEKSGGSSSKNKEKDKQDKDDNSVNGNDDKEENDEKEEGVDNSHKLWEEGLKKLKEKEEEKENKENQDNQEGKDKNQNKNQNNKDNSNDNNQNDNNDSNDNNKSREQNEKEAFEENLEKRKQELQNLKEQLIEASKQAGLTTNAQDRHVDTTGYSKPIVDWRYILREAVSQNVDWSLKNSYIEDGVVTYKLETYPTPETEIVLDTSGSINETLLRNFLRECKNILQHSKVKVGCFDTQFYGFEEIRREKDIESLKFKGYGGTDFNAAVNAFSKRVENKIIFTDGYAPMPDKAINAIWLVYGEDEINPKGGKVIYITDDMLRELNQPKGKQKSLRR